MIDQLRDGDRGDDPIIQESTPPPESPMLSRKSSLKTSTTDQKSSTGRRKSVGWADEEGEGRKSLVQEFSAKELEQVAKFSPPPRGSNIFLSMIFYTSILVIKICLKI